MKEKRRTSQGGVAFKRCDVCYLDVLSAYRGEVTAVGKCSIQSVSRDGAVVGKCECGRVVVWTREVQRPR